LNFEEILTVLKHDLHKVKTRNAIPHKNALPDKLMQKADGTAAWMSRNWGYQEIDEIRPFRKSLVFHNGKNTREIIIKNKNELGRMFSETDAFKLHSRILNSELLNVYHEAKNFPHTSLKYHLLLVCSIYYNLKNDYGFEKLYLCENQKPDSVFQIIYKDDNCEWALLPKVGMSRMLPDFSLSWVRRTQISIGGDDRILDGLLSQIKSWSAALATIEDLQKITEK
jgi:hypothetical protein